MKLNAALKCAVDPSATAQDRSAALTAVAVEVCGIAREWERRPSEFCVSTDVTAVIDALCSVFEQLELSRGDTDDHNTVATAALLVVDALPPCSWCITVQDNDAEDFAVVRDVVFKSKRPDRFASHAALLDKIMTLILLVTRTTCFLLSHTSIRESVSVKPLACLITAWTHAFRGKEDCLGVVDPLFAALLGHRRCCEQSSTLEVLDRTSEPVFALKGSDLVQQTLDVVFCITSTFAAATGSEFEAWAWKTPYWPALLNLATHYVCAFNVSDVLHDTMPAVHTAGVLMFQCLSPGYGHQRQHAANAILHSPEIWKRCPTFVDAVKRSLAADDLFGTGDSKPPAGEEMLGRGSDSNARELASDGSWGDDFFRVSTSDSGDAVSLARPDWVDVCPSRECGALFVCHSLNPLYEMLLPRLLDVGKLEPADIAGTEQDSSPALSGDTLTALRVVAYRLIGRCRGLGTTLVSLSSLHLRQTQDFVLEQMDALPAAVAIAALESCYIAFEASEANSHVPRTYLLATITSLCAIVCWNTAEVPRRVVVACWLLLSCLLKHACPNDFVNVIPEGLILLSELSGASSSASSESTRLTTKPIIEPRRRDEWGRVETEPVINHAVPNGVSSIGTCLRTLLSTHPYDPVAAAHKQQFVAFLAAELRRLHQAVTGVRKRVAKARHSLTSTRRHALATAVTAFTDHLDLAVGSPEPDDRVVSTLIDLCSENTDAHPLQRYIAAALANVYPTEPAHVTTLCRVATEGLQRKRKSRPPTSARRGIEDTVVSYIMLLSSATEVHTSACLTPHFSLDALLRATFVRFPYPGVPGHEFYAEHDIVPVQTSLFRVVQLAELGSVSVQTAKLCWKRAIDEVCFHSGHELDELEQCLIAGRLLRAVPRAEHSDASDCFCDRFFSEIDSTLEARAEGRSVRFAWITVLWSTFCEFGDPSQVRVNGFRARQGLEDLMTDPDLHTQSDGSLGWALTLARSLIDASTAVGITLPWRFIEVTLHSCRNVLRLPDHVHPSAPPQSPSHRCERTNRGVPLRDGTSDADQPTNHDHDDRIADAFENGELVADAGKRSDITLDDSLPSFPLDHIEGDQDRDIEFDGENNIDALQCRIAIATVLAVAEWMHHNCHSVVSVRSMHQGRVLERTISGSSAVIEQHCDLSAASFNTPAAKTAASVMHWLMLINEEQEFDTENDTLCPIVLVHRETVALQDRVVRWAVDPSLNAALLMSMPVSRDDLLRSMVDSEYLSLWATSALEEALDHCDGAQRQHQSTHKRPR